MKKKEVVYWLDRLIILLGILFTILLEWGVFFYSLPLFFIGNFVIVAGVYVFIQSMKD